MTHETIVPAQRREATLRFGALTLDTMYAAGTVTSVTGSMYEDAPSLIRFAGGIFQAARGEAYYHAFHSGRGLDIVLSNAFEGARWWTPSGLAPITDWTSEDDRTLAQDAALRTAAGAIEAQGLANAFDAIGRATKLAFARPELLGFAARCVAVKKFSVAGPIIDDRLAIEPKDPRALLLDAKITMSLVSTRQWPVERLKKAEAQLAYVIQVEPTNLEARLLHADVPRFGGDAMSSAPRFEAVIRDFPKADTAHYNLGVILLPTQPARALDHFGRGRALAPNDPDYVLGEARALIALQRPSEARERLQVAERMSPKHPLIPKLRAQLAG